MTTFIAKVTCTTDTDETIVVRYQSQWPEQALRFALDQAINNWRAKGIFYDQIRKIEACVEECEHDNLTSYDIDGDTLVVCMDCEEHFEE